MGMLTVTKRTIFAILFFSYCSISRLSAQAVNSDTTLYDLAVKNVMSLYNIKLGENTHLYNGVEYIEAHPGISGTLFWRADKLEPGSIYYDGVYYPDILLAYDAVKQEVVIKNQQRISIRLLSEKIDYFILSDQLFIHFTADSTYNPGFKPGFYNILYDGVVTAVSYRKKVATRLLVPIDHSEFLEQSTYFIRKEGIYYPVDSKSSLLSVLKDKKEEVKKFLQKNKFNFKKDFENILIKTADYYSQLKK